MTTRGKTFMNAVIGAIVTIVLFFLPLSPVLGGSVSGYLQGGDQREGSKVGSLAGLMASIPLFLTLLLAVPLFVFAPFGVPVMPVNAVVFAVLLLLLLLFYTVVLGTIGGIVGVYLARENIASPAD